MSENIPQPVEVIYSHTFEDVGFYDLADPDHPVGKGGLYDPDLVDVRGYGSMAIQGPDDTRWLYLANDRDELSYLGYLPCNPSVPGCDPPSGSTNGSVRVLRVENHIDGIVTDPENQVTSLIGYYAPSVCCGVENQHFSAFDAYVVEHPTEADSHVVWVNFSSKADLNEPKEGLMVLTAHWNGSSVDFSFVSKTYFEGLVPDDQDGVSGRLTYDPVRLKLYASYGADGVAMYNVSDPLTPQLEGAHSWLWLAENPMTSLHLWPGPGNHVYVALMNWGVGIIDATSAQSFAQGFAFGPYETAAICDAFFDAPPDPGFPDRSAVYVADGIGGVHRIQFLVFGP